MKTYIALLRGINVGGKNTLPMKELAKLLEDLGSHNVKTYIQSGNIVLQSKEKNATRLANKIRAGIKERFHFEPHVLLLKIQELETAIKNNPFPEAESEPTTLHLGFLASAPKDPDMQKLKSIGKENERFVLKSNVFYLHAPDGIGRSKLAASAEKLLGVPQTGRNWRTVCQLMDIVKGLIAS